MTNAERAREYRKKYRDAINARGRERWKNKKRHQRRAAVMKNRKCPFCGIRMASRTVAIKTSRYCDSCRKDPEVRRFMAALYTRRYFQKKSGINQDSLTLAEEVDSYPPVNVLRSLSKHDSLNEAKHG